MRLQDLLLAMIATAAVAQAQDNAQQRGQGGGGRGGQEGNNAGQGGNNNTGQGGGNADPQQSLTLDASQVQAGLQSNGQETPTAGQSPSLTSGNNFINFCLTRPDLPLTNGKQIATGSCNPTPMGVIVAQDKIPSVKFQSPKNFGNVAAFQDFDLVLKVKNLQAGAFVNPQVNYYGAPGQTNKDGIAIGHAHITMQKLASIDSTELPDNSKFAFFKGVNDPQDGQGNLKATVTGGVEEGAYRVCTIISYSNHQGVLPAIAQRGAIDDCIYITVGGSDSVAGAPPEETPEDNENTPAQSDASQPNSTQQTNGGQPTTTPQNKGQNQGGQQNDGQGGRDGGRRGGSRFRQGRQGQRQRFQRPQRRSHSQTLVHGP